MNSESLWFHMSIERFEDNRCTKMNGFSVCKEKIKFIIA